MYPDAPIYTAFIIEDSPAGKVFKDKNIIQSWAATFFGLKQNFTHHYVLAPLIWESFDFDEYDIVILSASWYITKGIITRPETKHICYCHNC